MGISNEGYRKMRKKVKLHKKRSFRGEDMKDPKEDAVEQQMDGTLYFTNFKWKKEISTHTYNITKATEYCCLSN